MQAVILAGGKGTRLGPYTATFPKPLMPLGEIPILEIVIRQLKRHGFRDVIISTGHLADLIKAYFGDGRKLGVKITYVYETKPLNTAGALALVEDSLEENFLVMNGDILTTLNYTKLFTAHVQNKATATIGVHERQEKIDYGVILTDEKSNLKDYSEKPVLPFLVSMGVNILNKKAITYIKKGEAISMPDLMIRLKQAREKVVCFKDKCEWLDIGRPSDYERAQKEIEERPERYIND